MITFADKLVLAVALLLLPVLYVHYWSDEGPAATVRIAASGQADVELPLSVDRRVTVHGPLGDSLIELKDGHVRFLSSPCRGQQCVHTGWLARAGELAACLPNGITVNVVGRGTRFDSINF